MILVYAQLGATLSTLVLFSAGAIVGREIMRKDTEAKLQTKDEAEEPMNKKE